jgi:hypothetical protein
MPLTPTSTNDGIVLTDLSVAISRPIVAIPPQCLQFGLNFLHRFGKLLGNKR